MFSNIKDNRLINSKSLFLIIFLSVSVSVSVSVSTLILSLEPHDIFAQSVSIKNGNKTNQEYFNNTLYVSATTIEKAKSDLVTISIGVETTNKTAVDAVAANSFKMNNIVSALRDNGVSEDEISTSQYSINPNYNYSQSGNILETMGFTVTNTLKIQSMNLSNISSWIDSAVNAGANTIGNIDFQVSEKRLDNLRNMLIEDAIAAARQKANIASSAVGLNIIGIKSMMIDTDGFNPPPQPFSNEFVQKSALSDTLPTPIIPGEQEISVSAHVVYLLG